jgi:protein gp37
MPVSKQKNNGISWTQETWNPIVGCSKVSSGCKNCWAERQARLHYHHIFPDGWDGHVEVFFNRMEQPLHWRKPRKIAVGLMGDLFHPDIPVYFQESVFRIAISANQHTFQFLTKRANTMSQRIPIIMNRIFGAPENWIMPGNIWLGVSVENQATADARIPLLLQTPAAVRFVSAEPMLGPINLRPFWGLECIHEDSYIEPDTNANICKNCENVPNLDWIIMGGESGHGARPIHPDWVRSIRNQCQASSVPFHFKQWGEWAYLDWRHEIPAGGDAWVWPDGSFHVVIGREMPSMIMDTHCVLMRRVGKKAAGRILDRREWLEFPEEK